MAGMDLVVNLGLNATQFTRGLAAAQGSLTKISSRGLRQGSGGPTSIITGGLGKTIVMANLASKAVWKLGAALAGAAADAVKLHAQTEQTLLSFEVLAGGKEIGTALFSELEQIAQNTALTFDEVSASAKQLLISFDPTQVPGLIRMLGNISASMDLVSLREMAWLLQTSREEGKLLARDLRQFTTRGIPVPNALKEVLGLEGPGAGEKLSEMVTAGEVKIKHLFAALQKLGSGNILERMGDTLIGKWMQMVDAQRLMMRDLGGLIAEVFNFGKILDWAKSKSIAVRESFRLYKPVYESIFEALRQGFIMTVEVIGDIRKGLTQLFDKWIPDNDTVIKQIVTFAAIAKFGMEQWRLAGQIALVWIHKNVKRIFNRLKHFVDKEAPVYWDFITVNGPKAFDYLVKASSMAFKVMQKNAATSARNIIRHISHEFTGGFGEVVEEPLMHSLKDIGSQISKPKWEPLGKVPGFAESLFGEVAMLDILLKNLTGKFGDGMNDAIKESLEKLKQFMPEVAEKLGEEKPFDFGGLPLSKKSSTKKTQELGALQRGSEGAIQAVLRAMGGRDKTPEVKAINKVEEQVKRNNKVLQRAFDAITAKGPMQEQPAI
jgi:hypothetical protein